MRMIAKAGASTLLGAVFLLPTAQAIPTVTCPGTGTQIEAGLWSLPDTTPLQDRKEVYSGEGPNWIQ